MDLDFVGPRPRIAANAYERYGARGEGREGGIVGRGIIPIDDDVAAELYEDFWSVVAPLAKRYI